MRNTKNSVVLVLFLTLLAVMSAHSAQAILPGDPGFRGCVIATDKGALQDIDCDKVPDVYDNCPLTLNPDQVDRDYNGIGDACDLIIDEIQIDPDTPMQGRSMVINVAIMNNRAYPMRNLVLKAEAPTLGVATSDDVAVIAPGERLRRELIVRVPECAPSKLTDLVVMAEYPFAPGQKEVFSQPLKIPVVPSGTCTKEVGSDKTIVNIMDVQDVTPENGALYPFTIHNNWPEGKAYVLSIDGLDDWGYSEIQPGTVIVVPPGEARDGALQVWARQGVSGKHSFTLTIQAKDDLKQVQLLANVPVTAQPSTLTPSTQLLSGIIGFVALVIIIIFILVFTKKKKK